MCISTKIRCGSKSGNLIALILQPLLLRNSKCFVFVCFPSPKLSHCSCQPVRLPSTCVPCNREGNGHESGGNDAIVTAEVGLASSALFTCSLLRQCWRDSSQAAQKNKLLTTLNGLAQISRLAELENSQLVNAQLYGASMTRLMILEGPWRLQVPGSLCWYFYLCLCCVLANAATARVCTRVSWRFWCLVGSLNFYYIVDFFSFFLLWKIEAQLFCKKGVAKLDILAF